MINFFRNLDLSSVSYWLGCITGILFTWVLLRIGKYLPNIFSAIKKNFGKVRENLSTNTETRLRNDIYRFVQKQHLAASLFSLDEIAVVPKVLTPLIQSPSAIENAPTDCVSLTVPYVPDWPELAATYKASTMSLVEALQGGANIILAGHSGSGKTFALAWLTSYIIRKGPGLGVLEGLLPLYVQAGSLIQYLSSNKSYTRLAREDEESDLESASPDENQVSIRNSTTDPADQIIDAISSYTSPISLARLPSNVHTALDRNRAILIIDQADELPPAEIPVFTSFIKLIKSKYPNLRIIVALSYENLAGLPPLGFSLLGLAAWSDDERDALLQRWKQLWVRWIYPLDRKETKRINSYYLNSWLKVNNSLLTPLEYTLKVWSAYSGDVIGTDGVSAIEAHLRRMTFGVSGDKTDLERFALDLLISSGQTTESLEKAKTALEIEREIDQETVSLAEDEAATSYHVSWRGYRIKNPSGLDTLTDNGFLVHHSGSQYGFCHPIFFGYLAGNALSRGETVVQVVKQSSWSGRTLALKYLARFGDVAPLINKLLQYDDVLHTNHLEIARWLQVAPKNKPWRSIILRTLTSILQREKETITLGAKIISALAFSGDEGVSIYFRQLLKSENSNLVQLAALGCGILAEKKSIEDLNALLQGDSPTLIRAAALGLSAIADKQSLEILVSSILTSSELVRRYAAEALANNPTEGYPVLQDGSNSEDLLVRRAVAFGLIRVNQPWALKILENMQLEDNEWVVRNAAIQAFDELEHKKSFAPQPIEDLTESHWLIEYATKNETAVAPGQPAEDLLIKALANGTNDEVLYAINYLCAKCDPKTINYLQAAYLNNTGELRDAAYYAIWIMSIAGIRLPTAFKYNIK